jgi:hypothetical protein
LFILRAIRHNCSDDGRKELEKRKLLFAPGIDRHRVYYNEEACDGGLDLKLTMERLRGVDGWFDHVIWDAGTRCQDMGMDIHIFLLSTYGLFTRKDMNTDGNAYILSRQIG